MLYPGGQIAQTGEGGEMPKWKKHKRPARRRAAAVLATLRTNESVDAVDAFSEDDHEEKPPFHLFFDIEAIHMGRHDPNLLIAEAKYDHPFLL